MAAGVSFFCRRHKKLKNMPQSNQLMFILSISFFTINVNVHFNKISPGIVHKYNVTQKSGGKKSENALKPIGTRLLRLTIQIELLIWREHFDT